MNINYKTLLVLLLMAVPIWAEAQLTSYMPNGAKRTKTNISSPLVPALLPWATGSNWEIYDSVNAAWLTTNNQAPTTSTKLTIVRSPDTVWVANGATLTLNHLTIDSGAILYSKATAQSSQSGFRLGSTATLPNVYDSVVVFNNGMFGLSLYNNNRFDINKDTVYYRFAGPNAINATQIKYSAKITRSRIMIDNNMNLTYKGVALTSFSGSNISPYDSIAITINAGKTVKLYDSSYFHMSSTSTSVKGGLYMYNINGTLDLSASNFKSVIVPTVDTLGTSLVLLNVNGTLNLPKGGLLVGDTTTGKGKVQLRVNTNGVVNGLVDSSLTMRNYLLFVMTDSSATFRKVCAAVDTTYPIGTADTVNNTVKITNTGAVDTISISVKNTFTDAWPAASIPRLIKKQWRVVENTVGGSNLAMKFMFVNDDKGISFTGTAIQGYVFTGVRWKRYAATLTGAGTQASPYMAAISGVDSFRRIVIGDSGLAMPVPVISYTSAMQPFVQVVGTPSASQSFTVTGASLAANISLAVATVPAAYQISLDNNTWATSLTATQAGGVLASTPIYVRLNAGSIGTYGDSVTLTSLNATTVKVPLTGNTVAVPVITSTGTMAPFVQPLGSPSNAQSFSVAGTGLLGNLVITAPANYQISKDNVTFNTADSFIVTGGTLAATPVYARLNATALGTYSGNIVLSSKSATSVNVPVTGSCVALGVKDANRGGAIAVYPNPVTNNRFMVKMNGVEAGEYTISVINIMGQKVATQTVSYTGTANEYSVALPSSLPAGSYQLNVSGAKVSMNTKISVQ